MDEVWRSKEKIRDDITKKYNEIECLKHRNDKEAIWAAMHVCDDYMKKSKVKENTWMWESFRKLKKELEQNIQDLYDKKTTHRWWGVEKHIERLATRVNEAENEMIRKIRMVNERARMTNLAKESAKWTNQTFLKYDPQRLWMIFTEASNPVKIHEVMWAFFKDNKDATYMLDYKDCKRADIRNKVMRVTKNHTWLCYIKYNEKTWTYNLYDWTSKEQLTVRAEIWDWVRIWSSKERWFINENREQARLNQKKEYNKENVSALYYRVPDRLRKALWEEQIYNFLIQAESRLDEVVKEHQKWWYRLDYEEPITSKWSDNFLMQAKFSWTEWENVRAVFRKDDVKNDALFNIMKDNKWYVKAYLTGRIREKWQETGYYALRDKVINKYEAITENSKVKEMDYWITSLITLVENLEGVHWETTKELVRLEQYLKNIKNDFDKAIKNNKVPTQDERSKMRDRVITLFLDYKSHDGSFASMTDWTAKRYITEIFKADSKSAIQRAVSSLWVWTTVFNNTSREHIVDDIREDIQTWAVEWNKESLIEKPDYDACFKKINTLLKGDIKVDNDWKALINETTWEPEITGNKNEIDKLYMYAFSDWSVIPRDPFWWGFHIRNKKIIKDLSNLWYLPKEVDVDDAKLQELAWKLMDSINHKNYMADNFKVTSEEIKSRFVRRKEELEGKNEKSNEEMNELTWLLAILENDSFIEEEAKKETMMWKFSLKYWGFNDIFHWVLSPWLIKEWGWLVSWDNHDIYNDSLWFWGRFDRSDKNSEQIMPMLRDVLVEVAITSVAIAAGTVTMGTATAAIYGARAALIWVRTASVLNKLWKVAKIWRMCVSYWKNAKNLERIANVISKSRYAKNLRTTAELAQDWKKVSTLTKTAKIIRNSARVTRETMPKTAMVLEWTGFHVSSTALHNYIDWKPITEGLNPFGSTYGPDWEPVSNWKWYVQSIAFLWVLKAIWAPLQKEMQSITADMLWERLTESQFWKIVQNMWSLVWEMGSMMATEQVLSLTFEQQFSPVTTESMIHMVGMVLWLRWTRKLGKAAKWTIKKYRELANGKWIDELVIQTEEGVVTLDKDWIVTESTDPEIKKWKDIFEEKKNPDWDKKQEYKEGKEWGEIREWDMLWEQREKLKTREEKAKFLTDNFHIETHGREKLFQSFSKEQISILKQLKDLGLSMSLWKVAVEYAKLGYNEINTLKILKEIWVDISSDVMSMVKLKPEEINVLKQLKGMWIDISSDAKELSKLTPEEINTLRVLKELWVDVSEDTPWHAKLTQEEVSTLKELKELWVNITEIYSMYYGKLTSIKEDWINKLKELKDLWVNLENKEIGEVIPLSEMKLSNEQKEILRILRTIWIDISVNTKKLSEMSAQSLKNLKNLHSLWIDVSKDLVWCSSMKLTKSDIEIIKLLNGNWNILLNPNEVFNRWWLIESIKELRGKMDVENILAFESKFKYEDYWIQQSEITSYINYRRWKIIENIETYVQNTIWEKRNIWVAEILNSVRVDILTLPKKERVYFMKEIYDIAKKFNTVRKYIDFKNGPYKTPKELLLAMRWIKDSNIIKKITDDITVRQHGTWLHFFVWDETSYEIIYHETLDIEWKKKSGWFNTEDSEIKELKWTLSVWNWSDPGMDKSNYKHWTILHEGQHNRNSYFMRDKTHKPITRAKDEITAFLRDGRWIFKVEKRWDTIEKILTTPASEKWLYQYELEWEAWETHKQQVRELLKYANDLVELTKNPNTWMTREKVISLLSDVPVEWWKDLHSNLMEAIALHNQSTQSPEKIKSLRWHFVKKIKEWSDKVRLVRDLASWWNVRFPNYKINLDGPEFWRTGNAKKENIVSEINVAKSIDEVKYILNNPKYSHIEWWKNHKSWMEISAMVDDVISGKYGITYLPSEIRNTVKKLMN